LRGVNSKSCALQISLRDCRLTFCASKIGPKSELLFLSDAFHDQKSVARRGPFDKKTVSIFVSIRAVKSRIGYAIELRYEKCHTGKSKLTWDRCYDFKMIFANFLAKKLAFLTQSIGKLCKILIITSVFDKNANFFAENCRKSQKIVIITSTPVTFKNLNVAKNYY
jgi:hypothetical protein